MAATLNFTMANNVGRRIRVNMTLNGEPWDLSGYTAARMQLRSPAASDVAVLTLTTAAGTLELDGTALVIDVPRGLALGVPPGTYDHDVLFFSDVETRRPLKGTVIVEQGVTR